MKTLTSHINTAKLFFIIIICFSVYSYAGVPISLKINESFRFSDGAVVNSSDKNSDLTFYVNSGRQNSYSFALGAISAKRIKEFGKEKPDVKKIPLAETNKWPKSVNAPSPGYYAVVCADGKSIQIIHIVAFENQGKASSFWKLKFSIL